MGGQTATARKRLRGSESAYLPRYRRSMFPLMENPAMDMGEPGASRSRRETAAAISSMRPA